MLSVKAREAADTIFKVFGMTQLSIKPQGHEAGKKRCYQLKCFKIGTINLTKLHSYSIF